MSARVRTRHPFTMIIVIGLTALLIVFLSLAVQSTHSLRRQNRDALERVRERASKLTISMVE